MTHSADVPEKKSPGLVRRAVSSLQAVIGAAFLLATLFTAWTPGESTTIPNWQISQVLPVPTQLPTLIATPTAHNRPLIGIVSGHWGNDSGSVCPDGLTEAEINQTIATLVQKQLNEVGYDVDLLKEFDPRLTGYKALALISIHADSCDYINEQATGYKVAAALASPNPEQATRLTACLRSRYAQATGLSLHSTSVTGDMTNYHAFNEIDPETTAAIIETGFLNLDRQFLTEQPQVAAQGIVNGILCFLNNENITGSP
ncbi:MAG: N-acetylmuramoyl-L-alanine amidase [Anaerolineales bacterium]|jgi:N-acetylmuramoyl-L-alanine amidase|nr:N-acetylmuramoyl-L-alanine amidase [Anaerolineales bacterium]